MDDQARRDVHDRSADSIAIVSEADLREAIQAAMIEGARIALERVDLSIRRDLGNAISALAPATPKSIAWAAVRGNVAALQAFTGTLSTLDPTTLITRHLALSELAEHDAGLLDIATPAPE